MVTLWNAAGKEKSPKDAEEPFKVFTNADDDFLKMEELT